MTFPLSVSAIRVEQSIGVFYVAVLPASVLLQVCYSDALHASLKSNGIGYELGGTQRNLDVKRLKLIADFIDRSDSAFPNSIILAANQRMEDGLMEDEAVEDGIETRWSVRADGGGYLITIPTAEKLAAVIDGQHRLFAFTYAQHDKLPTDLICSIFIDLPKPIQAQIFATINSTQKPVSKSLTYELFGYNIEEESEDYWAPDKLAVYLSRKLATSNESPLAGRIMVAPTRDLALEKLSDGMEWKISTAAVVEGIIRLISTNPKRDSNDLMEKPRKRRLDLKKLRVDSSPLRGAYIGSEDLVIYTMIVNYLMACAEIFWANAKPGSFIVKTIGIQAVFDILRDVSADSYKSKDISTNRFLELLRPAGDIDFSSEVFRNASGAGRANIKNAIRSKLKSIQSI